MSNNYDNPAFDDIKGPSDKEGTYNGLYMEADPEHTYDTLNENGKPVATNRKANAPRNRCGISLIVSVVLNVLLLLALVTIGVLYFMNVKEKHVFDHTGLWEMTHKPIETTMESSQVPAAVTKDHSDLETTPAPALPPTSPTSAPTLPDYSTCMTKDFAIVSVSVIGTPSSWTYSHDPAIFTEINVNSGNYWNQTAQSFLPPCTDFYYVGLTGWAGYIKGSLFSFGFPAGSGLNLYNLSRQYLEPLTISLIGRESVALLNEITPVKPVLGENSTLYTPLDNGHKTTSFSVFRIRDISPMLLSLKRTTSYGSTGTNIPFYNSYPYTYPGLEHYDETMHEFVCSQTGFYYFSFTVNLLQNQTARVQIRHSRYSFELIRSDNTYRVMDTISRSAMFECQQGETVSIFLESGEIFASDDLPATWIGFQYLPKHNKPVIWAAYRTTPFHSSGKMDFNEVLINHGNGFYSNEFHFTISGYYFLYTSNTVEPYGNCEVVMTWYEHGTIRTSLAGMFRYSRLYPGYETLGRPFIAKFEKGETLRLYVYTGMGSNRGRYSSWSNSHRHISFIGFLLQPI